MKLINRNSPIEDYFEGQILSYPCDDLGFLYIAEINEDLAKYIIDYYSNTKNFMNKLAIVMSISERQNKVTALYKHDFQYWIIQKKF